jgi:hypothetical protein
VAVTTRFERRPGSEETLLALYDAVGVAEELDLAEEAHDEAFWAEIRALYDWPSDEADVPADLLEDNDPDDTDRITMSQAVGIIEHLLGGRPMRSSGQQAS